MIKVGGASLLTFGIVGIVLLLVFLFGGGGGTPPVDASTAEASLKVAATGNLLVNQLGNLFFLLTWLLLIPASMGLYFALKEVNRSYMLISTVFLGLAVTLSLVGESAQNIALINLSQGYTAATTEAQKSVFIAAAEAIRANNAPLMLDNLLLGLWLTITSLVMRKGVFGKGTAYLGLVSGIFWIIHTSPVIFFAFIISFPLQLVWSLLAGYKLYKLGR